MPFLDSLDIANRALDHLGQRHIATTDEDSTANEVLSNLYDKLRRPELRRNPWKFAKRVAYLRPISATTMLLVPRAWNATVEYLMGAVVADANGLLWTTQAATSLNDEPGVTTVWERYFGPLSVDFYDSTESYYRGELVYQPGSAAGSFVVFRSLIDDNTDAPDTATAWDGTVQYEIGNVVLYSGTLYRSLIAYNLNNTPADGPGPWDPTTVYSSGDQAEGSDGYVYTSAGNSNEDNDPVLTSGYWTATGTPVAWSSSPSMATASTNWVPVYASLDNMNFSYPIGVRPPAQQGTHNIFRLPSGFLRMATLDPKQQRWYDDWDIQGDYFVTQDTTVLFAFIADVTDVQKFDDMFCEGLACRMALEGAARITQNPVDFQQIGQSYQTFMTEARMVNAIETEYQEVPEDEYIQVRV